MKQKLTLLALAIGFSFNTIAQEKSVERSFENINKITLSTASGDCSFAKSNSGKVEVTVTYSYSDDVYKISMKTEGDELSLKEKFERNISGRGHSKWAILVPDGVEVSFNSGSGDISARDVTLNIRSNTGSGDVKFNRFRGDIDINTGSGNIDMEDYNGSLKLNAGSGDVDLTDAKGAFKVNLGSGDVELNDLDGRFSINTGSGDIEADNVIIAEASHFNSGSGDAEVKLKADLEANISINSGSGDAILDFNGTKLAGEVTMKASKEHGDISAPFKFDSETEEGHGRQAVMVKKAKLGNSDIKIGIATGSGRAVIEN